MSALLLIYLGGFALSYWLLLNSIMREGVRDTSRPNAYIVDPGNLRGAVVLGAVFSLAWPVFWAFIVIVVLLGTLVRWVRKGNHD